LSIVVNILVTFPEAYMYLICTNYRFSFLECSAFSIEQGPHEKGGPRRPNPGISGLQKDRKNSTF